jgi:hypothetical protein
MSTTSARRAGSTPTGPAPDLPRAWWAQPYLWLSLPALALLLAACASLPWGGDYGIHFATVERLRLDLTAPGNPMVDASTASPYYSPWTVLLAMLASATGWSTSTVLSVGGAVAVLVFLSGVWRFTRALTPARWAPVLMLPCLLLLWGSQLFAWSGFLPLASMVVSIAYPSTLALGLTLHLWAFLPRTIERGWPLKRTLALGLFAAVILLVHQFTGVVMLLGTAAFAASGWRALRNRGWLRLLAGVAVIAVLLGIWPYYSFFGLTSPPGEDAIHRALYDDITVRYGLAALGLPALAMRFRRNRLDPLLLLFLACAAVYVFGWVSGHYAFGRVLPGAMLALQAALAVELAQGQGARLLRWVLAPLTALALLWGAWAQAVAVPYALTGSPHLVRKLGLQSFTVVNGYSWITRYVKHGDVVMTDDYYAQRRVPAYGAYVVFCPYPDPFLKDWQARSAATRTFFDPATGTAERDALLKRYHAGWIIAPRADSAFLSAAYQQVAKGPNGVVLYRVAPPGSGG